MSKRIAAKHKIDRRLGVNLWGRPKSPLNKRSYRPGQHGQARSKPSDYAIQLRAKQKLKGYYGNITEKQFHKLYKEAVRRRGDTSENLIELLERRLDAVVYRMKLVSTPFAARQMVSHGHILVNGKRLDISSYQVKDGDEIELRNSMRENENVIIAQQSGERDLVDYIEMTDKGFKGKYIRGPQLSDVPYPIEVEPNLVTEFYSR